MSKGGKDTREGIARSFAIRLMGSDQELHPSLARRTGHAGRVRAAQLECALTCLDSRLDRTSGAANSDYCGVIRWCCFANLLPGNAESGCGSYPISHRERIQTSIDGSESCPQCFTRVARSHEQSSLQKKIILLNGRDGLRQLLRIQRAPS